MYISNAIKPFLLLDISMNEMIHPVFEELKKVEDTLPPKLKSAYDIAKYNDYNNRIFKCLYRVQKETSNDNVDMEIAMNCLMDDFNSYIREDIDMLYESFVRFITETGGEGINIEILARLQMNSLLIETALILARRTTGAKPMLIGELLRLNNVFISKTDNRENKESYDNDKELDELTKEFTNKIIKYKWNSESVRKMRLSAVRTH